MEADQIKARVKCCACGCSMSESEHVNLMQLQLRAEWEYPCAGNVLTGEDGLAVAILCDRCLDNESPIIYAVEYRGEEVVYHELADLTAIDDRPDVDAALDVQRGP